jgi:4-hydroxybenzoate polyprenyltransferase
MAPWIRLLRPKQWIKNGFVFAPLFFSGRFSDAASWHVTLIAAACFCIIASFVYIINDIRDVEEDRLHPVKKNRPLAAGTLGIPMAFMLAVACAVVAMVLVYILPVQCSVIAMLYVASNAFYTYVLKRIAIIDIFFVAFCYVLRVLMGAYALQVVVSPWIILATFTLALFLGFGKRYHEMGIAGYAAHKPNLKHYSRELLDRLVTISGAAALMTYAIYAAELSVETGHVELVYTVGFVAFGLFRYLQSIHVYGQGGEPESVILRDKLQLANLALWLLTTMWILF